MNRTFLQLQVNHWNVQEQNGERSKYFLDVVKKRVDKLRECFSSENYFADAVGVNIVAASLLLLSTAGVEG